eukprot:1195794-Amphidinium_carterae.1
MREEVVLARSKSSDLRCTARPWRDIRLSELPSATPPSNSYVRDLFNKASLTYRFAQRSATNTRPGSKVALLGSSTASKGHPKAHPEGSLGSGSAPLTTLDRGGSANPQSSSLQRRWAKCHR